MQCNAMQCKCNQCTCNEHVMQMYCKCNGHLVAHWHRTKWLTQGFMRATSWKQPDRSLGCRRQGDRVHGHLLLKVRSTYLGTGISTEQSLRIDAGRRASPSCSRSISPHRDVPPLDTSATSDAQPFKRLRWLSLSSFLDATSEGQQPRSASGWFWLEESGRGEEEEGDGTSTEHTEHIRHSSLFSR